MKQVCNSELSVVNVNKDVIEDEGRVFTYSLNKKKTKAKLLKGAKRTNNLEMEVRDGCVNLRFCDGSFYVIVLPIINSAQFGTCFGICFGSPFGTHTLSQLCM